MNKRVIGISLILGDSLLFISACRGTIQPTAESGVSWQEDFDLSDCTMVTTGSNPYFILEPGFEIVLESSTEKVVITVLDETVMVAGIETRVIEEMEWKNGSLIEISRNFFALCEETIDVYYFGEDVDMFSGGELASHSGEWRARVNDARAGLMMPGEPTIGNRYFQKVFPVIAMDRVKVISLDAKLTTPAGIFKNCVKTLEGTALNPTEREKKKYAPGIGLIQVQKPLIYQLPVCRY